MGESLQSCGNLRLSRNVISELGNNNKAQTIRVGANFRFDQSHLLANNNFTAHNVIADVER